MKSSEMDIWGASITWLGCGCGCQSVYFLSRAFVDVFTGGIGVSLQRVSVAINRQLQLQTRETADYHELVDTSVVLSVLLHHSRRRRDSYK